MMPDRLFLILGDEPIDHEPIDHEPCGDCVRCATCRREWCPTVMDHCPGDQPFARHPTGGGSVKDEQAYCYKCTNCPGGYFQFHDDRYPPCVVVEQPPHVIAEGKGVE